MLTTLWNPFVYYTDLFDSEKETKRTSFKPAISVYEDDSAFYIDMSVAGIEQKYIKIKVDGGIVEISGERKRTRDAETNRGFASEISYGTFSRSFYLPEWANEENLEASYKNGMLTLTVKKTKKDLAKEIVIQEV